MLTKDRLILGTAQLTAAYGLFAGEDIRDDPMAILEHAFAHGIATFDTAALYGDTEEVIRQFLKANPSASVITKSTHIPENESDHVKACTLNKSVDDSLERLGLPVLPVFLLHNEEALDDNLACEINRLKETGRAERVGISISSIADIDRVLSIWTPDVVQVAINLFDQRLLVSGHLRKLKESGIEVHARSAFLQGVLLAHPQNLPLWLSGLRDKLEMFIGDVGEDASTRAAACLGFLGSLECVDRIVVGAQNIRQIDELLAAAGKAICPEEASRLAVDEARLVEPWQWPDDSG